MHKQAQYPWEMGSFILGHLVGMDKCRDNLLHMSMRPESKHKIYLFPYHTVGLDESRDEEIYILNYYKKHNNSSTEGLYFFFSVCT